ncbi:MAG: UDP-2,3-diacylglucosamine diphosphatase LpxI [Bdellovibrionota bacterium]
MKPLKGQIEQFNGQGCHRQRGGVLVKLCKREQDLRVDLPTIGVKTIQEMSAANITALILEPKKALLIDPDAIRQEADKHGIVILVTNSL